MFTIAGDPHCKHDNLDKINTLFDIIEDLGNPCIILGDLLDTKEVVRGRCLNTYFKRLSESKLKFIILVGNHDWFNLDCQEHSLQALSLLDNVTIIDSPQTVNLDGVPCRFYPFSSDVDALRKDLSDITPKPIFGHFDTMGFDYGNGYISEHGLTEKDFKKHPIVISGHYHKYQKKGNLIYLGTPFSHTFGESNQDKYIGVFEPKTAKLELLDSPFPRHMTYEVSAKEADKLKIDTNDYNRIILTGTSEEIAMVQRIPEVKYIEKPIVGEVKESEINETQSLTQQFSTWATKVRKLDSETLELGIRMLKEAGGV